MLNAIKNKFGKDSDIKITIDGDEYVVLTNDESNAKAKTYIRDSLWAFNSDFIDKHSNVKIPLSVLDKIKSEMCEDCNELIYALISPDFDEFVEDAINADGRGHFVSDYDGKEIELMDDVYLYRV